MRTWKRLLGLVFANQEADIWTLLKLDRAEKEDVRKRVQTFPLFHCILASQIANHFITICWFSNRKSIVEQVFLLLRLIVD